MELIAQWSHSATSQGSPASVLAWRDDSQRLAICAADEVTVYGSDQRVADRGFTRLFSLETGPVSEIRWLSDRRTLVTLTPRGDGNITVTHWDTKTKQSSDIRQLAPGSAWSHDFSASAQVEGRTLSLPTRTVDLNGTPQYVQMSRNGMTAVLIHGDDHETANPNFARYAPDEGLWNIRALEVWDVPSGERLALHERVRSRAFTWLSISPDGGHFILRGLYQGGEGDGDVRRDFSVFAREDNKPIHRVWGFFDDVPMLPDWAVNGRLVMYWAWSQSLSKPKSGPYIGLFDLAGQQEIRLNHHSLANISPSALAWSPDKRWLAIGDLAGIGYLFALARGSA